MTYSAAEITQSPAPLKLNEFCQCFFSCGKIIIDERREKTTVKTWHSLITSVLSGLRAVSISIFPQRNKLLLYQSYQFCELVKNCSAHMLMRKKKKMYYKAGNEKRVQKSQFIKLGLCLGDSYEDFHTKRRIQRENKVVYWWMLRREPKRLEEGRLVTELLKNRVGVERDQDWKEIDVSWGASIGWCFWNVILFPWVSGL